MKPIRSLLVADRSEIAICIMYAAKEMEIRTVAIYANEERFAPHRFKADESYLVGAGKKPMQAYLDIDDIIRIAKQAKVDAIHPGSGLLAENPEFAQACAANGILFIGPAPEIMRTLGDPRAIRDVVLAAGIPVIPTMLTLPNACQASHKMVVQVEALHILKADVGRSEPSLRVPETAAELSSRLAVEQGTVVATFGNAQAYLKKSIPRAHQVEVQIFGDAHGNLVHLFERDCSVQWRNQKLVERTPAPYLTPTQRDKLCGAALKLAQAINYTHAGTVVFLMDVDSGEFYFIGVKPRIQVEYTITEQVTGIDLIKAQIRVSEGATIGKDAGVPMQSEIRIDGHALQCRVTTEDPTNNFTPTYGRLLTYRSVAGFGIRLDTGMAYSGAVITPYCDSLLVKVSAWALTADEAIHRMDFALRGLRIDGVATNLAFLEDVINHPQFVTGECMLDFIEATPNLLCLHKQSDGQANCVSL